MAFTTPVFNLFCDVWNAGHTQADDTPDVENVNCQFYIYSRGAWDIQPCDLEQFTPKILLRMSIDNIAI